MARQREWPPGCESVAAAPLSHRKAHGLSPAPLSARNHPAQPSHAFHHGLDARCHFAGRLHGFIELLDFHLLQSRNASLLNSWHSGGIQRVFRLTFRHRRGERLVLRVVEDSLETLDEFRIAHGRSTAEVFPIQGVDDARETLPRVRLGLPVFVLRDLATRTMKALLPFVQIFVGGISDAAAMLGIEHSDDLHALAKQIITQFPNLTHAAFTLRDGSTSAAQCFSGALYEAATDTLHTAPRYTITQIIDRLGAGDAFTAGLIYSFLQHFTLPDTITFATAAGCLAHSVEGDYNYSTRAEIETLMQGDGGGRVSR